MKKIYTLILCLILTQLSISQTELIKNIAIGIPSSTPGEFIVGTENIQIFPGIELNGFHYFPLAQLDDEFGYCLWRTDGTGANTERILTFGSSNNISAYNDIFIEPNILINDYFYFKDDSGSGNESAKIWRSDGTAEETEIVVPISNPQPSEMALINGDILYSDFTVEFGRELYIIPNGLPVASPQLLKNIRPGSSGGFNDVGFSSNPEYFNKLGNVMVFVADDGTKGDELWITDGTETGTVLLKDIRPNGSSNPRSFIAFNNKLYFFANDGSSYGFWETDGTNAGTQLVKSDLFSNEDYLGVVYNNKMYFGAEDSNSGIELWTSDGTTAGTQLFKDINPSGNSEPNSLTIANNLLFFVAEDGTNGDELWVTDGTEGATIALTSLSNLNFNNINYYGKKLFSDGSRIYFNGDFSNTSSQNVELGVSEGTPESTNLLFDINPNGNSSPFGAFLLNDNVIFRANDGINGFELWKTNVVTLSNEDVELDLGVRIYPNPTTDYIYIKHNINLSLEAITIYAQDGRLVKHDMNPKSSINVSDLQTGMYVIKFKISDGRETYIKMIKK